MPKPISMSGIGDFDLLPNGRYAATFSAFKFGVAKSGNEKVTLEWTFAEEPNEGRKTWRDYSLSAKALWALRKTLLGLGVDSDVLEDEAGFDLEEVLAGCIGQMVILAIAQKTDTYQDDLGRQVTKTKNIVLEVEPYESGVTF